MQRTFELRLKNLVPSAKTSDKMAKLLPKKRRYPRDVKTAVH